MEDARVLVVSDHPDRINFLNYHIRSCRLRPISYPNYRAATNALKADAFGTVVVDLTLPVDSKIALLKTACVHQKNARIMAIGKTLYLQNAGVLERSGSVEQLSSIQEFPERLRAHIHKEPDVSASI